jgi:hypothetical protein
LKRFPARSRLAFGGRPGERLSQGLVLPINKDTLLERVKQLAQSRSQVGRIPAIAGMSGLAKGPRQLWNHPGGFGTGSCSGFAAQSNRGLLRKMAERTSRRGSDQPGPGRRRPYSRNQP